jgi:predicted RND superfamily exporter protein
LLVVVLATVLGLGGAAFALRLSPTAATDTFVSSSSPEYRVTQRFYKNFGEEPIEVLVKGNLQQLVLSSDLERLAGLEGCLSGNVPASGLAAEGGANGPCGQLRRAHTVKVVFGPGTFITEAVEQSDEELTAQTKQAEATAKQSEQVITKAALARGEGAAQARKLGQQASSITLARFKEGLATLALQYGLTERPSLENLSFISTVVFESDKPAGTPKQRFAYLFPNHEAALVSVRLKSGSSERARTRTIALIREAVAMKQWHLAHGESYLVSGEPVIVADLTGAITHSIELLLVAVLLVMAGVLGLIFRPRLRLLPLGIAGLATALTFGALSVVGASLTVASIAVLPVLVGLAVDYAIQFQSRVEESFEEEAHRSSTRPPQAEDLRAAIKRAAAAAAPTIATAGIASVGAILVLLLSPVPMVRGFGVLLVVGVVIAFLCALTVGSATLVLADLRSARGGRTRSGAGAPTPGGSVAARGARSRWPRLGVSVGAAATRIHARAREAIDTSLGAAWRGARELLLDNPVNRFVVRVALVEAVRRPGRVLGVGLALAALGWGLDTQTHVETDITKLVPQNLESLQNLSALERATGVGGQIDLMVSAKNLTKPSTIEWMSSYESAVLKRFGYSSARGCGKARLCPAFSLPDLFAGASTTTTAAGAATSTDRRSAGASSQSGKVSGQSGKASEPSSTGGSVGLTTPKLAQADVQGLLDAIPPYFSQDVIAPDRRVATLAFGIRLMPLAEQQRVIETMRSSLHPPTGVSAQLVGLAVLAAQSDTQVASPWRRLETLLVGLVVVALVLLIAFRWDRRRALAPLAPIVLATGWSALILFAVRVPLNPMSVTLGALVIAISTEFSVLLSERYRQERLRGESVIEALRRTYERTGAAVAASGVTAIAGFGVLVLSDIRMLRDFGLVTLIDLSVSLVGVLVALPAALLIAERDEPAKLFAGLPAAIVSRIAAAGRTLGVARRRRGGHAARGGAGSEHEPV